MLRKNKRSHYIFRVEILRIYSDFQVLLYKKYGSTTRTEPRKAGLVIPAEILPSNLSKAFFFWVPICLLGESSIV